MVIKIYVSNTPGNMWMRGEQTHIRNVLESKGLEFVEIDVGDPNKKKDKDFMQSTLKLKDEDLVALPPQIFNGEKYRGDYSGFFTALELEQLFHYLDLEAPPSEVEYQLKYG